MSIVKTKIEKLERINVSALDEILGKKFTVLDDGFVRLVDYMGDDSSIVQAARVSYGSGTKKVSEDAGLIRYLMRHRHSTPFEMCELKLHVRVPMDTWRQWIRHRTASVNEYSTRYSEAINSMQKTKKNEWRLQAKDNKQGSAGIVENNVASYLTTKEQEVHELVRTAYEERLELGIAREQARKDLPLSTYTEAYWKIDLKNLLGFLSLRMDSHAQKEIRDYACIIGNEIVANWVPQTWAAFCDYRLDAMGLTSRDAEVIFGLKTGTANGHAHSFGWLDRSKKTGKLKRNRERSECESKLKRLGLEIPWQSE
jgi:thymidylate synthase (FAD)